MDKFISPIHVEAVYDSLRKLASIACIIVSSDEDQAIAEYRQIWKKIMGSILRVKGNRLGTVEVSWSDMTRIMSLGMEAILERLEEHADDE